MTNEMILRTDHIIGITPGGFAIIATLIIAALIFIAWRIRKKRNPN